MSPDIQFVEEEEEEGGGGTPTYVQGNATVPQTPQTMVTVSYNAAQTAGDLNLVIVGWNDTTQVSSVTDSNGNPYTLAVGPTFLPGTNGGPLSTPSITLRTSRRRQPVGTW